MSTKIIGPLRWQEEPSRISIDQDGQGLRAYYQVTSPRDIVSMCKGRPVEELPRILTILSPSHHIAAAAALDNLFGITIPLAAENIRKALGESLTLINHSRRLFFLLSSPANPLGHREDLRRKTASFQHWVIEEAMRGILLFQEAASILGGRYPHPVAAIAGGVSRPIKEVYYPRLAQIAGDCLPYALRLRDIFADTVIGNGSYEPMNLPFHPVSSITYSGNENAVVLTDPSGTESARFAPDKVSETLQIVSEPWTYLPFVHMKGMSWESPISIRTEGLFLVGPLARLNRCLRSETPGAEEERQRLVATLGPPPHFSAIAGYWSLLIELIESAERIGELFCEEKLAGPQVRTVATGQGRSGLAAYEAPEGFICHSYEVDQRGLVQNVTILDAASENNGVRSLLIQKMVEEAAAGQKPWDEAQKTIELSLAPF